jgi:hypothetical protein
MMSTTKWAKYWRIIRELAVATRLDWWLIFLDSGQSSRTKSANICSSEGDYKIVARWEEAASAFVCCESY